jgi:hypothetical protein
MTCTIMWGEAWLKVVWYICENSFISFCESFLEFYALSSPIT